MDEKLQERKEDCIFFLFLKLECDIIMAPSYLTAPL